jgi:hypothetical protein
MPGCTKRRATRKVRGGRANGCQEVGGCIQLLDHTSLHVEPGLQGSPQAACGDDRSIVTDSRLPGVPVVGPGLVDAGHDVDGCS